MNIKIERDGHKIELKSFRTARTSDSETPRRDPFSLKTVAGGSDPRSASFSRRAGSSYSDEARHHVRAVGYNRFIW